MIRGALDDDLPQLVEDVVGLVDLLDLHLAAASALRVERGLPRAGPVSSSPRPLYALPASGLAAVSGPPPRTAYGTVMGVSDSCC